MSDQVLDSLRRWKISFPLLVVGVGADGSQTKKNRLYQRHPAILNWHLRFPRSTVPILPSATQTYQTGLVSRSDRGSATKVLRLQSLCIRFLPAAAGPVSEACRSWAAHSLN